MDSISTTLDFKVDFREKKADVLPLRSWSRYYVKIEAIRCFPCYMKISLFKKAVDEEALLVIRVNIPGLEVYPVSISIVKSRTKPFAYGMYWKQNRKQCIAFLALDSQLSMEAHMKWVELQIQNLETYRRDILQSSRCSRIRTEQSLMETEESGIYQNMNDTNRMKDVNDILGPLPKIPDTDWSRRVSGISGIYEEIMDPASKNRKSRASIASGIYEEMRLDRNDDTSSPPPLPPRVRKNTEGSLHRSNTTPESDYYVKKKPWNLFENVFGKSKKSEAKKRERPSPKQPKEIQLLKSKRNSFSSPDLTHLYCPNDMNLNQSGFGNCSFEIENPSSANMSASNSYMLENLCEDESEMLEEHNTSSDTINISQKIRPNFKLTLENDISSINLVGSNFHLNLVEGESPKSLPQSPAGYVEMRPGRGFNKQKIEELDGTEKDNLYKLKYSFNSPITYKREQDYKLESSIKYEFSPEIIAPLSSPPVAVVAPESQYVCMNKKSSSPRPIPCPLVQSESVYMRMDRKSPLEKAIELSNAQNERTTTTTTSVQLDIKIIKIIDSATETIASNVIVPNKRHSHSIDDKFPSYFPNYDVPVKCVSPHPRATTLDRRTPPKSKTPEVEMKSTEKEKYLLNGGGSLKTPQRKTKRINSFNCGSSKYNDNNNNNHKHNSNNINNNNNNSDNQENSMKSKEPSISKKYATIARTTSTPNSNSPVKGNQTPNGTVIKSDSISPTSMKRFGSLPRFKKFDFSPLRMRITSVLQRNNSGSL
ncbi:unnamed protein product [Diamesa tonsa]